MSYRDDQISSLREIFAEASFAPVFRSNPKYPVDGVSRIRYRDVLDDNYILRIDTGFPESGSFWDDAKARIIASYSSLEALVDDGWELD
jgi:hypothetical protein